MGDIIRLSRLDGEEPTAEEGEQTELRGICEGVLSALEMAAAKRGITLTLSGEKGYVRGSGQLIEEIVFNLTDNAVKYNREGARCGCG